MLSGVHPYGVNDGPFGQDQLKLANHSTCQAPRHRPWNCDTVDTVRRRLTDGLVTSSFFLMFFRFLLSASVALGALAPIAAEARSSCGLASFYGHGDGYAWQTMANGKPMNPQTMITAHPWLPLGTRLRVSRNGRSVIVKVTDRGPWSGDRLLDLSPAAFSRIASLSNGVASVCYSVV